MNRLRLRDLPSAGSPASAIVLPLMFLFAGWELGTYMAIRGYQKHPDQWDKWQHGG